MKSIYTMVIITLLLVLATSCTKLDETLNAHLTSDQVGRSPAAPAVLLQGIYASLEWTFTSYQEMFALTDVSTDEAIVPTRGNNWDDNGQWRVLHQHKWDGENVMIKRTFNSLGGVVFAATDLLRYNATPRQKAEARMLRAWAMYCLLDLFDQVPHRLPGETVIQPAGVWKGMEALDSIIVELNTISSDLPDGPSSVANKYAAKTLLMKCYLNKAVYKNRANPAFDAADMNKVIALSDDIINSNQFSLSTNYFDNFCPSNALLSKENIYTQPSNNDGNYVVSFSWLAPLHYVQGGFNGFTTLSDFYKKFESSDKRRGQAYAYPNGPPNPGNTNNVGFLIGQQYDIFSGDALPLIYSPEVKNIEPGPDLESTGIRPIKYAPDFAFYYFWFGAAANEFVYFRFADVLLMKAEAIARGGNGTTAGPYGNTTLSIVNAVRTHPSRAASALSIVSLDALLDERGREMWWEGWRRQDMIRFKKYLLPFQEKNYNSEEKNLIFPIPFEQLAVNPNLLQNPGY